MGTSAPAAREWIRLRCAPKRTVDSVSGGSIAAAYLGIKWNDLRFGEDGVARCFDEAVVGNVCVKKFLGLPSGKIFQAIRRVASDEERSLNIETIEHAYKKGWINGWEQQFSLDTLRKRNLSQKQLAKRVQVNRKVLRRVQRSGG